MKKLFLLILSSLPFQIFADNNMISHVEDICMQNEGFYEISQEEPLRNKQVRILSGFKQDDVILFIKNSGLVIKNYPLNFKSAYLWKYSCSDKTYHKLNNKNLFSIVKNGAYLIRGVDGDSVIIGIYRDTMSTGDILSYGRNSQIFTKLY